MVSPQHSHCSSLGGSLGGDRVRGGESGFPRRRSFSMAGLCVLPMCIFRPFSDPNVFSHWSHLKVISAGLGLSSTSWSLSFHSAFLFRNASFLFWFLRRAEGDSFFFTVLVSFVCSFSMVSIEMENELVFNEKENFCPFCASAWQNSRHCLARVDSSSLRVEGLIFTDKVHI